MARSRTGKTKALPSEEKLGARDAAKRQTREALIAAMLALIPEHGLDASLDDVCDRAGFTRGAFYVHFRDRDELLAAAMERVGRGVLDALIGATSQDEDLAVIARRFLAAVKSGVYPLTRAGGVRPYQLLDACARSAAVRAQYVALVEESIGRLTARARAGQQRKTVRDDVRARDIALLAVTVVIGSQTLLDLAFPVDLARVAASWLALLEAPRRV
jgi:TetR/AcrR family transcriptional regulator, transcriptional repressor for nem operon